MPELLWAMLCENAIIDFESNNISLINVIEQFNPPQLPIMVQAPFVIVTHWKRSRPIEDGPEQFRFRFRFIDPENDQVTTEWNDSAIPSGRLRNRTRLGGLQMRSAGVYRIQVETEQEGVVDNVGQVEFEVTNPGEREPRD